MTKLELQNIISQKTNLKNLPNTVIVDYLDKLSFEFEETKQKIIELTYHMDNIEELYNLNLKEYQERTK